MPTNSRSGYRCFTLLILAISLLVTVPVASAQRGYPDHPIDFICNWGPGGGADQMARLLGKHAEQVLRVAMPVSNIPGASGNTGLAKIVNSRPDGYTISVFTGITLASWAMGLASYDVDDFEWLARTEAVPSYIFVATGSPLRTADDFVQQARRRTLRIATAGYGTLDDMVVRFLASKGLKVVNVPFAKAGDRFAAPLGGHVDAMYEEMGDVRQLVQSKQLRPLMVFTKQRNPTAPDVPTSYELGYEIGFLNWRGVITRKGVPPERVRILTDAIKEVTASPQWAEFCKKEDCQPGSYLGPSEFRDWVKAEHEAYLDFATRTGLIKK